MIECELKKPEEAKLEVHDAYIDVQVVVRGTESFGWSEREALRRPCGPFDAEKDIRFYDDAPPDLLHARAGAVHDLHARGCPCADGGRGAA